MLFVGKEILNNDDSQF